MTAARSKDSGARKKGPEGRRPGSRLPAPPETMRWVGGAGGHLSLIDQTRLPGRRCRLAVRDVATLWDAIRRLVVRGAPAIGVAAAYGVVLGAQDAARAVSPRSGYRGKAQARAFHKRTTAAARRLATSRPTAVNLFWALDRMQRRLDEIAGEGPRDRSCDRTFEPRGAVALLLEEARAIHREDQRLCRAIGRHGAALLKDGWGVLTHCNAGALATAGSGTALSVFYEAARQGKQLSVYADETRPLLQGARLTAWELLEAGIDLTLICDDAAASVLASGRVQAVVVGADRIASNGDTANKIGTLGVAILAREYRVPFYVAAPSTTFDLSLAGGSGIPIEERPAREVTEGFGTRTAPRGASVYNPAFDVTPARYIAGIITERGVIRPPYKTGIRKTIRR